MLTEEQRKAIEAAATEIEYMHADLMGRGGFSSDGKANPYAQALRELLAAHSAGAQTHKIIDDGEVVGYVVPSIAAHPQPMTQAQPVYDKSVVRRLATQWGMIPETDAARELIEAAKDVLANGHQHDVGGGDVFLGTCDSTERLQRALAEIERIERAKGE